jgi:hypothetical protein
MLFLIPGMSTIPHIRKRINAKRLSYLASTVCWMKQKLKTKLPMTVRHPHFAVQPTLCNRLMSLSPDSWSSEISHGYYVLPVPVAAPSKA